MLADSPAIKYAMKHDFKGFVTEELSHRKKCNLPPVWKMALVSLRDPKFDKLSMACDAYKQRLDAVIAQYNLPIKVRGPMPATISRLQQYHRMQIILQAPTAAPLQRLFAILRTMPAIRPNVTISVDIDPINLM